MLTITSFTVENVKDGCVTDVKTPHFKWTLSSDRNDVTIKEAGISVNGWRGDALKSLYTTYEGEALKPFTGYDAYLDVTTTDGETVQEKLTFRTGFLGTGFKGSFITDGDYSFTEKKISPKVMTFRKKLDLKKKVISAFLYSTAIGVYRIDIDGKKLGEEFLSPGFTSYKSNLQYQTFDVTDLLKEDSVIIANVAGGWAVGSFVYSRENRVTADKQSFLCELRQCIHRKQQAGQVRALIR